MFNLPNRKPKTPSTLEVARDAAIAQLVTMNPVLDKDAYEKVANHVHNLNTAIAATQRDKLSVNTAAIIAGNLVVTGVIVGYEQKHVVATKAKDFWLKFN